MSEESTLEAIMTYTEVAERYGITPDQARQLRRVMTRIWQEIASDWLAGFESEDEAYDVYGSEAAMVAEATLDAGRPKILCPSESLDWLDLLSDKAIELGERVWKCRS